jgi:hypothetical protein
MNAWITPIGLARARAITKDDLRKFLDSLEASSRTKFESDRLRMEWQGVDRQDWIIEPRFELEIGEGRRVRGAARRGRVTRDEDLEHLYFEFEDVVFLDEEGRSKVSNAYWEQEIEVADLFEAGAVDERKETLTSRELRFLALRDPMLGRTPRAMRLLRYRTEYSTRIALGLSCLVFVLIGAPVGMLSRRASFIGAGIVALLIVFVFYYPMHEVGKNLAYERILEPEFSMALPGLFVGLLGVIMTWRVARR